MTGWDKAKEYLIFYAKDDSIIPRRDIRNQLQDAVAEGDKNQECLNNLNEWFDFHCKNCDAEDCFGCTIDHLAKLIGKPCAKGERTQC